MFESYSAGTGTKSQINQDAVRIMKKLYGIDMEKTQYSKVMFFLILCFPSWDGHRLGGGFLRPWALYFRTDTVFGFLTSLRNSLIRNSNNA